MNNQVKSFQINTPEAAERAGKSQARDLFLNGYLQSGRNPPKTPPVTNWFTNGAMKLPFPLEQKAIHAAFQEWAKLYAQWFKQYCLAQFFKWGPWVLGALNFSLALWALGQHR